MPRNTYRGSTVAALLARARAELGADAVILRVEERRNALGEPLLELEACDAASAPVTPAVPAAAPRPARPAAAPAARPARDPGLPGEGRLVLAFVGPTGAGKTTTVAKLAGMRGVFGERTVGLLGLDTYRMGAVEQLAAYAELLGRPHAAAFEPADLPRALRALRRCDVLLVDCPGRGPRAAQDDQAVRALLAALAPAETHLVLPAGLQPALAERLVEQHARAGVTHLLASKVDECPDDWSLFDLAAARGLPMRWLADGQRVPQDLRSAEARLQAARASARGRAQRARGAVA